MMPAMTPHRHARSSRSHELWICRRHGGAKERSPLQVKATPHANAASTCRQEKKSYFDILPKYHIMPLTWPASLARRTKSGCDRRVVVNAQQARARPTTRICGEETMVAFALWRRCPAALAASIALLMAAIASVPAAEQDRFPQRP